MVDSCKDKIYILKELTTFKLSQKANKINFGNRNGKNDITHQTMC